MRMQPIAACLSALLLFSPLLRAQSPAAPTPAPVAGKVADARTGAPLAHALVTLQDLRSDKTVATVYTADDGTYRFTDPLPAGKYRLGARAAHHIGSNYLQHGDLSTAIVTGQGLPTDALLLSLQPVASIAGRVVDENGDPVPHATVTLFRQSPEDGTGVPHIAGSRGVDDNGNYDFPALAPGRYFVVARGTPWYAVHPPIDPPGSYSEYKTSVDPALDVAYPLVFYPAALRANDASPIGITGGEQAVANFQMLPQHAVTLTLHRAAGEGGRNIPAQLTEDVFGTNIGVPGGISFANSGNSAGVTETITGLAPGVYGVRDFPGNGNRMPEDGGTVDLTGGSVVRDLGPSPSPANVTLRLVSGSGTLPAHTLATLYAIGGRGPAVSNPVNAQGEASFDSVSPGDYRVGFAGSRRGDLTVAALTVNGHTTSGNRLHVTGGGVEATVTLGGPPVTVDGFVQRDGKGVPACLVVLVPAEGDTDAVLFRRDQTDLDGSFSLPRANPGKYLLVALENAWSLPSTDVHALEPYLLKAMPLVIAPNGSGVLHLGEPLLPQPAH